MAKSLDILRFVSIETSAVNQVLDFTQRRRYVVPRIWEAREERRRSLVYLSIRTLCAQDYRDAQFVRFPIGQRTFYIPELFLEQFVSVLYKFFCIIALFQRGVSCDFKVHTQAIATMVMADAK